MKALVCFDCATSFSLLSLFKKQKKEIGACCAGCGKATGCRKISFFKKTGFTDYYSHDVFEGDVLVNPYYGDFWTVCRQRDNWVLKLNKNTLCKPLVENTSFIIVSRNKGITRQRITGLKTVKEILTDPEGHKITFYKPINLADKLTELLLSVGYTI